MKPLKFTISTCLAIAVSLGAVASLDRYLVGATPSRPRPELRFGTPSEDYVAYHGFIAAKQRKYTAWTIEYLTAASFEKRVGRDDFTFYADPDTPKEFRATLADYKGEGFDRGHIAPARDMTHSAQAMRDCFSLANMMPQTPELNRGPWRMLEEHVGRLAAGPGVEAWVVTGPAWLPDEDGRVKFEAIGQHGVWAPTHCWKAVLLIDKLPPGEKPISKLHAKLGQSGEMAAWLLPNVSDPPTFDECRVSVDEVESATGFDLFAGLPDEIEDELEASHP